MDLIDMSGGAQENDPKWIFHAKDHMSKLTFATYLHRKTAGEVVKAVRQMLCLYGPCRILQHDRGREFANADLKALLTNEFPSVKTIASRPRHPETNGLIERANGVLGMLSCRNYVRMYQCDEYSRLRNIRTTFNFGHFGPSYSV